MAGIVLDRVTKRYPGGTEAVRALSLEIRAGEFLSLVGPSGCGKSTTLNLIAGLEEISEGQLRIDGRVANALSPVERDVAMVFQSYALYPHLTVRKNLAFPLEIAGRPKDEIARRVGETAERLGITALLERRPRELSGGQRQRVALGRALVRRPKVFLFDEPLSNLDPSLRGQLRAELKKLHEQVGTTFVYVTHDQAEAMTLSDRVAVMNAGVLQQVGSPRELYDEPGNLFVAEFFGAPKINVAAPEALGLTPPRPGLRAALRPEHLEVGTGGPPAGAIAGQVFVVEPLGSESHVTVEVAGARLVARASADFAEPGGAPVWLRPRRDRALFFDEDGRRVS